MPKLNIQNFTVTLQEGIATTTAWRDFYQESVPDVGYNDIFRGFSISKEEWMEVNSLIAQNDQVDRIRIYLARGGEQHPPNEIHVLLVPANQDEDFLDLTEPSSIFDFTTPCPHYCNQNSPLYGAPLQHDTK